MESLEKICIHKGEGCSHEEICDGRGSYKENGKTTKCYREVYYEQDIWEENKLYFS